MSGRHARLTELVAHALALDPEARRDYLDRACSDDAELKREAESLIEYQSRLPDVLKTGKGVDELSTQLDRSIASPPSTIGPYRIIEPVGSGGMGVVYLAEQMTPLRRRVAVKLIREGLECREVIARMESERQVLARMSHTNIATVFDAGVTESGLPYFVMEYLDGTPIVRYCDRERLGVRARVELFVDVCKAIEHAHERGIVHRDITPRNVLVIEEGGQAIPKVIDFGIAKVLETDVTGFTRGVLGTPAYMSPEQSGVTTAPVDRSADVYSLGALLLALLVGQETFESNQGPRPGYADPMWLKRLVVHLGRGRDSALWRSRAKLRGLPPRTLLTRLRGDLGWIITRAMWFEVDRRYSSVSSLLDDLTRYLGHKTIPGGRRQRLARLRWVLLGSSRLVGVGVVAMVLVSMTWKLMSRPSNRSARFDPVIEEFDGDVAQLESRGDSILNFDKELWDPGRRAGCLTLWTHQGDTWHGPFDVGEFHPVRNVVARPVPADRFQATATIVEFSASRNWQQAGILVMEDQDSYVRLTVSASVEDETLYKALSLFESDREIVVTGNEVLPLRGNGAWRPRRADAGPIEWIQLRIVRNGSEWKFYWSYDGIEFDPVGEAEFAFDPTHIALVAFHGIRDFAGEELTWDPIPMYFDRLEIEPYP